MGIIKAVVDLTQTIAVLNNEVKNINKRLDEFSDKLDIVNKRIDEIIKE